MTEREKRHFGRSLAKMRGLLAFAGVVGGALAGSESNVHIEDLQYGQAVTITPGERVILKADFKKDLEAAIENLGNLDNDPWSEVDAYFRGTSPFPEPSRFSFGGIKWQQRADGNVRVLYYTDEAAPTNPITWSFLAVEKCKNP